MQTDSDYLEHISEFSHEQLVLFADQDVGLKGAIAIHDTTLGPALGGCRMWNYSTENDAITDVLRLSRAMTYKNAAARLALGGGKAIVWGDPSTDKSQEFFRNFGQQVERLNGRYITTEDVGTTEADMRQIAAGTQHIVGLPIDSGGSGDPSPATGWGIFHAIRACANEAFGTDDLSGRRIVIVGLGKVGTYLAEHLHRAGAILFGSDISDDAIKYAQSKFQLTPVELADAMSMECDILAPCALGGGLNETSIPQLKTSIICGAANNQLLKESDGELIQQRSILYGPDYISNAGGVINLSFEIKQSYNREWAFNRTTKIFDTMTEVIDLSKTEGIPTSEAADLYAERILEASN